jgi:hypothetical protein
MPQPLATLGDRASSAMRSPQNLWIAGLTRGHDEVGILRMPFDPAPDVRAERPYAQTAGPGVVEGVPCDGAGYPLTLIFLSHDSVEEHDGVGRELILRDASQPSVNPCLVAAFHGVVVDYHAHSRHCARSDQSAAKRGEEYHVCNRLRDFHVILVSKSGVTVS